MTASHSFQCQYTRRDKYCLVGDFLGNRSGTLLDVGARDRVLLKYLNPRRIVYASCDLSGEHDYTFDLEQPLPLSDRTFDYVVALDVLEHLEAIHSAFGELMRIARRFVIISLPNLNSIKYRTRFLLYGRLNGKYDLLPYHQGDRHRWLTIYDEIYRFVTTNVERGGFEVTAAYNLVEFDGLFGPISRSTARLGIVAHGLFTNTIIFILQRKEA